jgi:hypothetical protein
VLCVCVLCMCAVCVCAVHVRVLCMCACAVHVCVCTKHTNRMSAALGRICAVHTILRIAYPSTKKGTALTRLSNRHCRTGTKNNKKHIYQNLVACTSR